jgi:hypothetical protein
VHIFHRMRKEAIILLHIQEKHLANYSHKLSIISKQSRLMHKELRDQVKTHAISDMSREKRNPANSPKFTQIFFFFFLLKNAIWKNIICTARSNLMMPIQKNSRSTCFFCLPLTNTYKVLSREIGVKAQLVPRLHIKCSKRNTQSNLMP